jgi:speckle-type POZ protein
MELRGATNEKGIYDKQEIGIYVKQYNSTGKHVHFLEPLIVKMSILEPTGQTVFQQMAPCSPNFVAVKFLLSEECLMKLECQQVGGSYTIHCEIYTYVKQKITSPGNYSDFSSDAINCINELSNHFGKLFDDMTLSDVNFNIGGCDFSAHKSILSARSDVFASMFKHPMEEQSSNQVKIKDIDPDVFQMMLRFIYTGRVQVDKLEMMAAGLFIAADKYLLDQLKIICENYLLHHMSPENCVVLLLNGDLQNPTELLKNAAKLFRRLPSQVMATERWEQIEKENPRLLCEIKKFLLITI